MPASATRITRCPESRSSWTITAPCDERSSVVTERNSGTLHGKPAHVGATGLNRSHSPGRWSPVRHPLVAPGSTHPPSPSRGSGPRSGSRSSASTRWCYLPASSRSADFPNASINDASGGEIAAVGSMIASNCRFSRRSVPALAAVRGTAALRFPCAGSRRAIPLPHPGSIQRSTGRSAGRWQRARARVRRVRRSWCRRQRHQSRRGFSARAHTAPVRRARASRQTPARSTRHSRKRIAIEAAHQFLKFAPRGRRDSRFAGILGRVLLG